MTRISFYLEAMRDIVGKCVDWKKKITIEKASQEAAIPLNSELSHHVKNFHVSLL